MNKTELEKNSYLNPTNPAFQENLMKELEIFLIKKNEIRLAYLYGSITKKDWTKNSDIDIGIVVDEKICKDPWYTIKLQRELSKRFQDQFEFDIRIINRASTKFKFAVIYKNPRIIVRDEEFRVDFETQIILIWYDIRETWINFYKEQAEALKNYD